MERSFRAARKPFSPYSIAFERSACSTPCTAMRASKSLPINNKAASNDICIFMTFTILSFFPDERLLWQCPCHGAGLLERAPTAGTNVSSFFDDRYGDEEKLPTCRHAPKSRRASLVK